MKQNDPNPQTLTLSQGFFSQETYDDYYSMNESASDNWSFAYTYQLKPHGLNGEHKILQLNTMQLSFGKRPGGMIYETQTPKGSIAIGVIEKVKDKACFSDVKLQEGDIVFFDDSRPFSLMSNDLFHFSVVSIDKRSLGRQWALFRKALDHKLKDKERQLEELLHQTWHDYTTEPYAKEYKTAEKKIIDLITSYLKEEELIAPKLTKGEKIALMIRDQVYGHIEGSLTISALAEQYDISEKTLQNSFRSLFGFTPKRFIRQLKLNLVKKELISNTDPKLTIRKAAKKWGFLHMGRFSQYYTELFGENPSRTLKKSFLQESPLIKNCVIRQEETE